MTYNDHITNFTNMVQRHDLTYPMSDDNRVFMAGADSLARIMKYARENLEKADAVRIWNANVDKKLTADVRKNWYWEVEGPSAF